MANHQLKITTLTPLHIGDGTELEKDIDYVVKDDRTYRVNIDAVLETYADRMRPVRGEYPLPGQLLQPEDYEKARFFRYIAPGAPRSGKAVAKLRSCIKDVHDRPYLPGSSLKGAFRTALAWSGWDQAIGKVSRTDIGERRSWAGQDLEHRLFGKDPNHDLMRALQFSDCCLPEGTKGRIIVVNANVLTQKSSQSPIELEAIAGSQTFEGSLRIDENLFSPMAERELRFSTRRAWLDELFARSRAHSLGRIQHLREWFDQRERASQDASAILRFLDQLANAKLSDNQTVIQVGWGGGWDSKTFWKHIQKDPRLFESLVRDFRMSKAGDQTAPRQPGDPFPRSRRLVMKNLRPVAPFGWLLVELS